VTRRAVARTDDWADWAAEAAADARRLGCVEFGAKLARPAAAAAASCSGSAFWTPTRASGEPFSVFQVEHDRCVEEKSRASLDLLLQFPIESGIPQQPSANHHHGEKRALNEIARHTKIGAIGKKCSTWTGYRQINPAATDFGSRLEL